MPNFTAPIRLTPKVSRQLYAYLIVVYGAATLFSLVFSVLESAWFLALGLPIFYSARSAWHWHIKRSLPLAVLSAEQDKDNDWFLRLRCDEQLLWYARLCGSSFLSRWLIVLNFQLGDGKHVSLLIFPDSIDADNFHRLQVWLNLRSRRDRL